MPFSAQSDRSLERRTLEARLRISEFAHSHSLSVLLQKTLDEAEKLTDSAISFFHFVENDQNTIWLQSWSTNTLENTRTAEGKLLHYNMDKAGVWVDCAREQRPIIYNDYTNLPHKNGLPEGHAPLVRILTVPIIRGGCVVAILGVGNKDVDYDETDVNVIHLLADLAWDITLAKRNEETLKASESSYRAIMDEASDGIFIADPLGYYIDVNRAGCALTGYAREEILKRCINELLADNFPVFDYLDELQKGNSILFEWELHRKDGSTIPVEISAKILEDGRIQGIVRDITKRKREEERVRYLAFIMDRISSAVISTDADLRIVRWNSAAERLYGWRESEAIGRLLDDVCRTEFAEGQQEDARNTLLRNRFWSGELKQYHHDGRELWVSASVTLLEDDGGRVIGGVTINHDITERKQAEEELRRTKNAIEEINQILQRAFEREQIASRTDSLTGLFNRRYFFELLEYEFNASRRYQRPLSIAMFDIDLFKQINDTAGHLAGDGVLKQIADLVRGQLRDSDVLSRYGGDEFVILIPSSGAKDTVAMLERVHQIVRSTRIVFDGKHIPITISVGVASLQPTMTTSEELLRIADQALYEAKKNGRNCTVIKE